MKSLMMQASYVVVVIFPKQHYGRMQLLILESRSKRPHSSLDTKITNEFKALILKMRAKRNLGARRLQTELIWLHKIHLSIATIHKVLPAISAKPIVTYRHKEDFQRYGSPIPDDIVQMDTCKIASGICQHTAIDECNFLSSIFRQTGGSNSLQIKSRGNL